MTDEQRKFMHARQKIESLYLNPITELLTAARSLVAAEKDRADRAEEALEGLRPVWAKGYTSDSKAAQVNANALAEIWQLLGVKNQTDAMARLRDQFRLID